MSFHLPEHLNFKKATLKSSITTAGGTFSFVVQKNVYWNFITICKGKKNGPLHSSDLLIYSLKLDKLKSRDMADKKRPFVFWSQDSRLLLKWTKYNLKVKIN